MASEKKPSKVDGFTIFSWVIIVILICLTFGFLIAYFTTAPPPECYLDADCNWEDTLTSWTCSQQGRCSCQGTDFSDGERPFRCDPAKLTGPGWSLPLSGFIISIALLGTLLLFRIDPDHHMWQRTKIKDNTTRIEILEQDVVKLQNKLKRKDL